MRIAGGTSTPKGMVSEDDSWREMSDERRFCSGGFREFGGLSRRSPIVLLTQGTPRPAARREKRAGVCMQGRVSQNQGTVRARSSDSFFVLCSPCVIPSPGNSASRDFLCHPSRRRTGMAYISGTTEEATKRVPLKKPQKATGNRCAESFPFSSSEAPPSVQTNIPYIVCRKVVAMDSRRGSVLPDER